MNPPPYKGQSFAARLGHALSGLAVALRRERSLRVQLAGALTAALVLGLTHAAPLWWALAALASGAVLAAEMFNTALEALADRLHPERHAEIKFAKDAAAGAVLLTALAAAGVALAYLWSWWRGG